jgi:hypothetical protein
MIKHFNIVIFSCGCAWLPVTSGRNNIDIHLWKPSDKYSMKNLSGKLFHKSDINPSLLFKKRCCIYTNLKSIDYITKIFSIIFIHDIKLDYFLPSTPNMEFLREITINPNARATTMVFY